MQTFIPFKNIDKSFKILDRQRLGKQRVEAIQIAYACLDISNFQWQNHPAVKMWKGYESFLIKKYLRKAIIEWKKRGYNNNKCNEHYKKLYQFVKNKKCIKPKWITNTFCKSHQSNLLRKNKTYYEKYFKLDNHNLEYIWPKGDK